MKLNELLSDSAVTPTFRAGVDSFLESGKANDHVSFTSASPPVKVARTLTMLLEQYRHLPIESVQIEGSSGCEFYKGELTIRTVEEERSIVFHWDCKWKAMQEGWVDYFGFPDQMRAAREFGYRCFRKWEETEIRRFADA